MMELGLDVLFHSFSVNFLESPTISLEGTSPETVFTSPRKFASYSTSVI